MKVEVRLFARARELAKCDRVEIDLPAGSPVAALRSALARQVPELAGFVQRCAVAVAGEYATEEVVVSETTEVALIPPVSGGQGER